jgi:hypothetical protein
MTHLFRSLLVVGLFCIAFPALSQETTVVVIGGSPTSKELKRSAQQLRLPVEQLKNARQALQEATELAKRNRPFPFSKIQSLMGSWRRLNRSKAAEVTDSFVRYLRAEAANAKDSNTYQQATSTAISLIRSNGVADDEKLLEAIQSWPDPPASLNGAADKYKSDLEEGIRKSALSKLARTEPEKAGTLLAQADSSERYYTLSEQIVRGFINEGKKAEAIAMVDQVISHFNQQSSDPQALQAYQSFALSTVRNIGVDRMDAVMAPLITQIANQAPSANCTRGTMKAEDLSVDLTCAEYGILNLVRGFPSLPGLVYSTLNSFPSLKYKLDQVGGIDAVYTRSNVQISTKTANGVSNPSPPKSVSSRTNSLSSKPKNANVSELIKELKEKAKSNPDYVRARLRDIAIDTQAVETLIRLASSAAYDAPELGSLALEIARPLVFQVESLQKRASILRDLISATRKVDTEVDAEILRQGYILADQLREGSEISDRPASDSGNRSLRIRPSGSISAADNLEVFLITELSKDDFTKAIHYVRSLENETLKLSCLSQMAQVLGQQAYF